jgi:hypothetical protein
MTTLLLTGCHPTENYNPDQSLSLKEKDSVLVDVIQYIQPTPEYSNEPKGSASLKNYYKERIPFYSLIYYKNEKDSVHYFLVGKKTASTKNEMIGVGGYFIMKSGKVDDFTEVFNMPKMEQSLLEEKGQLLFEELINNNNVNKYLGKPEWIEFPNTTIVYDKKSHDWKVIQH